MLGAPVMPYAKGLQGKSKGLSAFFLLLLLKLQHLLLILTFSENSDSVTSSEYKPEPKTI